MTELLDLAEKLGVADILIKFPQKAMASRLKNAAAIAAAAEKGVRA